MVQATVAMATVGGAVTASTYLRDFPHYGAQSVRYGCAAIVLAGVSRCSARWPLVAPRGREWVWLFAAAACGLSGYNLAVVRALDHAEPTAVATIVSGVPLLLAIAAPLATRRRVPGALVAAAIAVVVGAAIVQGGGHADRTGVVLSVAALVGECLFTLLSIPVLRRLGALSVAAHTSWIAALQLAVLGAVIDGRHVLKVPDVKVGAAIAYLVAASALAFFLWFLAVDVIGGELAGLAAGIIPITAVLTGVPLGLATFDRHTTIGTALVVGGVLAGLAGSARRGPEHAALSGSRRVAVGS